MRRILALLAATALSGCGVWSTTIRSDLMDYTDVLEQSEDKFLLVNILEARDNAPLHFAAIANIRGSFQATASLQGAVPVNAQTIGASTAAGVLTDSATPTIGVQSSPSFEVDPYESKDFVTGISSPIDSKFIKYWVDRGLDKRILFLLFFSSAEIVDVDDHPCRSETIKTALVAFDTIVHRPSQCADDVDVFAQGASISIHNNPRDAANRISTCMKGEHAADCHARTDFELYLKFVDSLVGNASANAYTKRTLIAHDQPGGALKDTGDIDPAKYQLELLSNGHYDLYSVPAAPSYAFCVDGKFDALSGWRVSAADDAAATYPGEPSPRKPYLPARHDVCSDSTINIVPSAVSQVLPGVQASLPRENKLSDMPQLDVPCQEPKLDPVSKEDRRPASNKKAWGDPARPYCALFLRFLATRHGAEATQDGSVYPDAGFRIILTPRSVAEMIRFVGDIAYYQDQLKVGDKNHNIPVTLGYDPHCVHRVPVDENDHPCLAEDGGWLFQVQRADTGRIVAGYRGHSYAVGEQNVTDHSLEVMSIITQLVNLNKSAADLHPSLTAQIVP